jgi:hypothetical protein
MPYSYATPPPQAAAARPPHAAIVAEARHVLRVAVEIFHAAGANGSGCREALAEPLAGLCRTAKGRKASPEQLIIAIKEARAALPDLRRSLGENEENVLALVITVCIEQYFASRVPATLGPR